MFGLASILSSFRRILVVSKKPDLEEYKTIAKITGIGIILIAVVGFIVTLIFRALGLGI